MGRPVTFQSSIRDKIIIKKMNNIINNFPKNKIAISFSGGRTSAIMTKKIIESVDKEIYSIEVTFANTGCEHPKTLEFINNCDNYFGFNTTWIEAEIFPEHGVGSRAKIVNFENCSRNGEPFEAAVAKYGVFSQAYPQCTSRLKTEIMYAHLRDNVGWKRGEYISAIGIRADEINRCSKTAEKQGFVYPLIDWGYNKQMVIDECKTWPFDLEIPEHYGNCVWCWKKSFRKLMTLAKEDSSIFDFPNRLEEEYSYHKTSGDPRVFFRQHKSAKDIIEMSKSDFEAYSDKNYHPFLDAASPCSESCEIGTDSADREKRIIDEIECQDLENGL